MIRELRRTGRFVLAASLASVALAAAALPPGTEDEILERIKPIGTVKVAEPVAAESPDAMTADDVAVAGAGRSGEEVYNSYCTACHSAGVAGAPVFADAEAWAPRIAKGIETLYESTYNGLNGVMPARGTCADCSDEELRATVDYMVAAAES
ncbi:MAG: c-type cytochrome [Pseudomonadales bacterium]|jgi:cytochrome c5|nr:c-type cytochrome [Pseudomonadales bacterium]